MESEGITIPKWANAFPSKIKTIDIIAAKMIPFFIKTLFFAKKNHQNMVSS
jgi:hypothetical protein